MMIILSPTLADRCLYGHLYHPERLYGSYLAHSALLSATVVFLLQFPLLPQKPSLPCIVLSHKYHVHTFDVPAINKIHGCCIFYALSQMTPMDSPTWVLTLYFGLSVSRN
jgi:hypothetical protein